MSTTDITPVIYRYFTVDLLTNEVLAEIPFQDVTYERALSAAGSFSGTIPVLPDSDKFDLYQTTLPGKTALYVMRNDTCVWGGIIWTRSYDIVSRTLSVSAAEFISYLQHRTVWGNFIYEKNAEDVSVSTIGGNTVVTVTLPSDSPYTAPANTYVHINFKKPVLFGLNGFYKVRSSPASNTTTFSVTMNSYPENRTISSVSRTTGIARINTTAAHEFQEGMVVDISGVTPNTVYVFNGTHTVKNVVSNTAFEFDTSIRVTKKECAKGLVGSAYYATLTLDVNETTGHGIEVNDSILVVGVGPQFDTDITNPTVVTAKSNTTVTYLSTKAKNRVKEANVVGGYVSGEDITSTGTAPNGTAKLNFSTDDVMVTFRASTYDYISQFLREIFTDFVINTGDDMGYVPTLLAGKIQSNPEVVSKKIANNVATLTLATKPVMIAGQRIVVSNLGSPFDGTYTVSAVDRSANTVSYARTSGDTGPTAVTHAPKKVTYRKLENGIATLTVESITYDVTFRQRTGTTVTLTTSGNHTFNSGDQVTVASLIGAGFNGTYTLTGVTSNTVTYTSGTSGNVSTTAATGTIKLTSNAHGLSVGSLVKIENVDPPWYGINVYDSPSHTDSTGELVSEYTKVTAVPSSTTFSYRSTRKPKKSKRANDEVEYSNEYWFKSEPYSDFNVTRKTYNHETEIVRLNFDSDNNIIVGDTVEVTRTNTLVSTVFNGTFVVTGAGDKWIEYSSPSALTSSIVFQAGSGHVKAVKRKVTNARARVDYSAIVTSYSYGPFPTASNLGITIQNDLDSAFVDIPYKPSNLFGSELITAKEHLDKYITQTRGFDYRIDCRYNTSTNQFTRRFVFVPTGLKAAAPGVGSARPITDFETDGVDASQIVFEYPGNIANFSIDESTEDAATRFFVARSQTGSTGQAQFVAAHSRELLSSGWPLLDISEKQDWPVYDQALNVDGYRNQSFNDDTFKTAKRYLEESRPPVASISVTVNGSISPEVDEYSPGYWCSLILDDEFIQQRLASDLEPRSDVLIRKIVSMSVAVPNVPSYPEMVTLNLIPEWEVDLVGE
jgi:hypothetical protein